MKSPDPSQKPEGMDWDLWIGPAENKGYTPGLHAFDWRGFWNYGTGALGDMGCHILDPSFYALELGAPSEIQATSTHWIPEVSTTQLGRQAASVVYDNVPAPWGNFAPPARRGVVNLDMWLWVNPLLWIPISVTAGIPTPAGYIAVTTTATPKKIMFDPGDGKLGTGPVECDGPGLVWLSQFGDYLPSTCMYKYTHASSMHPSGLFPATFSVQWHITWKSNVGAHGTIGDLTLDSSHQMLIREVQALISR